MIGIKELDDHIEIHKGEQTLAVSKDVPVFDIVDFLFGKKDNNQSEKADDIINNPPHYCFGKYEPVKVIQDWDLGFCLGNVIKYIARAGKKDGNSTLQDLKKAKKYLEFEIERLENE